MATYLITWQIPSENRDEAIRRFVDGKALQPPSGVKHLARWHAVAGLRGWAVAEADDPRHIADWMMSWSDLLDYDVDPVISDEEMGALFAKHGLGK